MRSRLAVRHRREPSLYVADGYAGVQIIAAAIESAGMTDPAGVAEALQHLTVTTPQGRYRFTDKDHSGLGAGDVAIAQPRSPEFQVVPWSARQLTGHLHLG
jgi:branched-chain amino acid transport system substrate-binding protein